MIKYALMAGLLLGTVIAFIFGSQYVVHVRAMDHVVVRSLVEVPTSLLTVDLSAPTTLPSRVVGAPTAFPTDVLSAPSVLPTHIVAAPTAMPTFPPFHLYCPAYSTSNTNSATSNYAVCSITACSGDTVLMTTFFPGSCNGDTYLRLYDPSTGSELAADDDFNGSACSQITYLFTASCRTYELREGCYGSGSCGGRVFYSVSSAAAPTTFPTSVIAAPTVLPTLVVGSPTTVPRAPTRKPTVVFASPTTKPTVVFSSPTTKPTVIFASPTTKPTVVYASPTIPSNGHYCPSFTTSNTNSATSNYAVCPITACPGDTVLMTTSAPGSCSGDNYLRLYDPSTGEQLTYNDDYNGVCSQITYTFYTSSCRTYELREGCFSSGSCGGVVYYTGSSAISQSPIAIATAMPSTQVPNSVNPTLRPTSSQKPTVSRSRKPTIRPSSRSPTSKPTSNPSYRPTRGPTITFTSKPTPRTPIKPTRAPSRRQTTAVPTSSSPTVKPTRAPSRRQTTTAPTSSSPTIKPTRAPSRRQTTAAPTTGSPTVKPTRVPSRRPSRAPTI